MGENERNFGKPQWYKICREPGCGKRLGFSPSFKSGSGFLIPMDAETGERHACANSQWQRRINAAEGKGQQEPSKAEVGAYFNQERIVLDVMAVVVDANSKLDTFYLKLERVPKTEGQTKLG